MKTCFVLEGGALRGLYTAGVLDYLYEKKLNIDCIIGVSAGALFGVNYFSKQPYRVLRYNKKFCNDKRYMSLRSLVFTGNMVNKKFAYYRVTKELDPFDEKEFENTNKDFYAVVSNIETGDAEYIKIDKPVLQLEELRASSAMPFVTKIVNIDGKKYLDGAVCLEMNFDRIVLVLTQPLNYRKEELSLKEMKKLIKKYKKYPNFVKASFNRPKKYNDTLDKIVELENNKKIFVVRPSESIDINPLKKSEDDLQRVYDLGKSDMESKFKDLKKYLK